MNLKTSLLKDKKLNSEKLRTENKKMELRLQQLKLAMCKEKEERLSSGIQSNWSSGTAGALLNYKPNLSAIDTGKRLRLKMLKEESVAPVSTAPGTGGVRVVNTKGSFMKSDAVGVEDGHGKGDSNRDFNGIARRGSNRHCGQCEENAAAVNCKECAEDYCPKCFAAFHLKGALRKHRSTPISTLNNRVSIPSPLFKPPDLRNISSNESNQRLSIGNLNDKKVKKQTSFVTENKEELIEYSKENFSPKYSGSSLAEGTYNEELSNQYFQEAVNAWRNNVELTEPTPIYEKHPTIEHSTETIKVNQDQRLLSDVIQFTPSLTYAEQLLLRKHRNNELAPVDMKYILNRLTKTNEQELLENQKLLQSNLVLETSIINTSTENALRNDEYHIDFECINRLINEADLIGGRQSSLTVQNVLASPFKVEELDLSCNTIKNEEEIPMQIELNQTPLYNDQVEIKNSNNTEIAIENDPPKPVRYDVKEKRSKSALNKNNNSGKPLSARRTPSRIQNGGHITSKPSVLLHILSDFSNYLPPEQVRSKNKNISDDKNEKRPASASFNKISYNFYKVTPNSWKPSQAWLNNRLEETDGQKGTNDLLYIENDNIDVEIESELEKLNLLSKEDKTVTDNGLTNSRVKSSARLTIFDDNNHNLFNECDLNDCDEESEKQEVFDQLNSLERELTVISKQEEELNFSNYDDIVADSLEIGNDNTDLNSMNLDKFCLEDSLDIPQSNSNTAREYDNIDDEDNEELMMNCSSRFDDYDDVYKLN